MTLGVADPFASSSLHRDVLDAPIPVDRVSRLVLLNELKNRAQAAIRAAQYPDALRLYEKALQVVPVDVDEAQGASSISSNNSNSNNNSINKERSVLEANSSLCHFKMGQWTRAIESAQRATTHDPAYVKGWFRLGQAHSGAGQYEAAVSALTHASTLEPSNKAILKEQEKFQKLLQEHSRVAPSSSSSSFSSSSLPSSSTNTQQRIPNQPRTEKTNMDVASSSISTSRSNNDHGLNAIEVEGDDDDEDGLDLLKSTDVVRGYKVVNGKKTSYFHNELTSDVAALIGDIRPKKLDEIEFNTGGDDVENGTHTTMGSAWNKAGTWEERDVSDWALKTLESGVTSCKFDWNNHSDNNSHFRASINKVTCKGHAGVASVRGKKRYIYEMELQVEWQIHHIHHKSDEHDGNTNTLTALLAAGTLDFPEVDGTCCGSYEATATISSCTSPLRRKDIDQNVWKRGLRDEIHSAINTWIETIKETY